MAKTAAHTRVAALFALSLGGILPLASEPSAQRAAAPAQVRSETLPGTTITFEMVPVPGGTVRIDGESVRVEPFLIGRTEVTWDMYDVFALGLDRKSAPASDAAAHPTRPPEQPPADAIARPSQPYGAPDYNWGHKGYPVISVTRHAAEQFCKWLSVRTGKPYRLPAEAEWARAAELAAGSDSTPASREPLTWHAGNSNGTTHPVASRKPDALGLYDLFGNATEWVIARDDAYVTRGGSFRDPPEAAGPTARIPYELSWQERDPQIPKSTWWLSDGPFVGFRLALSE